MNNMMSLWSRVEPKIEELIIKYVTDSTVGPKHTLDFVDGVVKELSNDKKKYHENREMSDRQVRKSRETVDRRLRRIKEDKKYPQELEIHAKWLCTKELTMFMEQGLRRAIYSAMEILVSKIIDTLERSKQQIIQYESAIGDIEKHFKAKVTETSENLIRWVEAEADELAGEKLFGGIKSDLSQLKNLCDLEDVYGLIKELLSCYNISDPFDGDIESCSEDTVKRFGDIFSLLLNDKIKFKDDLFIGCREKFAPLSKINICNLLVQTFDIREMSELFEKKKNLSEWPLTVFTNDPTTDHDPKLCEKKWVGVPNAVDLNNHPVWRGVLGQYTAESERFSSVNESYRMVFATEMGVFCPRNIAVVENYRDAYRKLSSEDRKKRHTNSQVNYPDLMPPDMRIQEIHLRAERATLLGKIIGLLKEVKDPETHFAAIYLYYSDPQTGMPFNEKVCPGWTEVVNTLRKRQVEKEIDRHSTGPTPLEILERAIQVLAESKKTREEKKSFSQDIKKYLQERLHQIGGDGNERHPAYQRDIRILSEFVKNHGLGDLSEEKGDSL